MKISLERHVKDSQHLDVVHIAFDGYGFRLKRELASHLLQALKGYYDGSLPMSGRTTESGLTRYFRDAGILIEETRPANTQGVFTNGPLEVSINDNTGYFVVSNNGGKQDDGR